MLQLLLLLLILLLASSSSSSSLTWFKKKKHCRTHAFIQNNTAGRKCKRSYREPSVGNTHQYCPLVGKASEQRSNHHLMAANCLDVSRQFDFPETRLKPYRRTDILMPQTGSTYFYLHAATYIHSANRIRAHNTDRCRHINSPSITEVLLM